MNKKIPAWVLVPLLMLAGGSTACASKLITGAQIKNGSIELRDLSPRARAALVGQRGPAGAMGAPGNVGGQGSAGAQGTPGASGAGVASTSYLNGPFQTNPGAPNVGQLTIAPTANTAPGGVAQLSLVPNDPEEYPGQSRTAIIAFHPERDHVEDATIKAHRHPGDGAPGHIQIHTKNAAGDNLISRFEIGYGQDDAYTLFTSTHVMFDENTYIRARTAGHDAIRVRSADGSRENFAIEDSGILRIASDSDNYIIVRVNGHLKKIVLADV